jgi:hypothetical protein
MFPNQSFQYTSFGFNFVNFASRLKAGEATQNRRMGRTKNITNTEMAGINFSNYKVVKKKENCLVASTGVHRATQLPGLFCGSDSIQAGRAF